jgi:hypothetical protein
MDITERLRGAYSTVFERSLAKEAADEIERLRGALSEERTARVQAETMGDINREDSKRFASYAVKLGQAYIRLRGRVDDFICTISNDDQDYMRKYPPSWYDLNAEYDDSIEFADEVEAALAKNPSTPAHGSLPAPEGSSPSEVAGAHSEFETGNNVVMGTCTSTVAMGTVCGTGVAQTEREAIVEDMKRLRQRAIDLGMPLSSVEEINAGLCHQSCTQPPDSKAMASGFSAWINTLPRGYEGREPVNPGNRWFDAFEAGVRWRGDLPHQVWLDDPPAPGWYWSVWNGCKGPEAIKVVYLDRGKLPGQKYLGPFEAPPMPDSQSVANSERLCICGDPENCTERIPGYRCRADNLRRPK